MQENKTYTLFINSNNKISGTNNNANYQINWDFYRMIVKISK